MRELKRVLLGIPETLRFPWRQKRTTNNGSLAMHSSVELEDGKLHVDRPEFLQRLRELFPISRIYYPGCGEDIRSLESAFEPNEIIYLDNDLSERDVDLSIVLRGKRLVIANYDQAPFGNQSFDAIFIQDADIESVEEFGEILCTLKTDGIIIYSIYDDCGLFPAVDVTTLKKREDLRTIDLPFSNKYYTAFQKVKH